MNEMVNGDRVRWQYTHWLNSRSATQVIKDGVFIGLSSKNKKQARVKFDGNKTISKVPFADLTAIKQTSNE